MMAARNHTARRLVLSLDYPFATSRLRFSLRRRHLRRKLLRRVYHRVYMVGLLVDAAGFGIVLVGLFLPISKVKYDGGPGCWLVLITSWVGFGVAAYWLRRLCGGESLDESKRNLKERIENDKAIIRALARPR